MTNRFDPVDFSDSFPNYEAFDNFSAERSVKKNFSSGLGRGSGYLVIDWEDNQAYYKENMCNGSLIKSEPEYW